MLKIIRLSDKPCFLTGTADDVVEVKFDDKSFSGALSWNALLDVVKRKAAEVQTDKSAKTAAKTKSTVASSTVATSTAHQPHK